MSRLMPNLGLRARLLLAVGLVLALALTALTAGFNLVLANRLEHDQNAVLRARAATELSTLTSLDGMLVAREAPDDGALDSQVWVFSGTRQVEKPSRVSPAVNRAARALAGGGFDTADVRGQQTRLLAEPVVRHGHRLGTVVVGASLAPYRRTERIALLASAVFALLLLAGIMLVARALVDSALRPVAQMTASAADWSAHAPRRRFDVGAPRDELGRLAATLNAMLDRIAASLAREQRFSAEISHELRTPLAAVRTEAELALRRERTPLEYRQALEHVLEKAEQMQRVVETLVGAARAEASGERGEAEALAVAEEALGACAGMARERGIELALATAPAGLRVAADAELVQRVLAPLLENGCRYGRSRLTLKLADGNGQVRFEIEDDGPGVEEGEAERIFEPGARGSAGEHAGRGAGLGLSLARRLARAIDGDVVVQPSPGGGRFSVRLPAAPAALQQ
ncbi:MAG: hypothetical protein QOJ38_1785 [Solirubrobacterales bacterium]|jgi:signal transduction histidine kinase|nr:hypothetical protein [Solirubrobacterales bacterium]